MRFIQIGSITNIFGAPVTAARGNPVMALVVLLAAAGAAVAVVPALVALTASLVALTGAMLAIAYVLFGGAIFLGALAGLIFVACLPRMARDFARGKAAQRESMVILRHNLLVSENAAGNARRRAKRNAQTGLPGPTIYVASTIAGQIEAKEEITR